MQDNTLIVVTGPTGVGKTELCLRMAEHFGVDIINADSRQIFAELPIGTAAPTAEQRQRVRHHFVATHHVGDYYSASMYEQDVLKTIAEIKEQQDALKTIAEIKEQQTANVEALHKKPLAILTGGSMMYIDAVCNGIDDIPTVRDDIRIWMKERLATEGLPPLVDELRKLDPEHWAIVDKNNPRRVVHALEICHQTGKTYTSFRTGEKKPRPFHTIKIGLTRDREELYERINARVLQMVDDGLEAEARNNIVHRNENGLNTVGYKEMFKYFDGEIPFEEAVRQIQSNTRQYARKQQTWYKRDTEMQWFHPDQYQDIVAYVEKTLEQL